MLCRHETPTHQNGPFTVVELHELLSFLNSVDACPNSSRRTRTVELVVDERKRKRMFSCRKSKLQSENSNRSIGSVDESKRKRMISCRDYAGWHKKRHLEELTEQMNRTDSLQRTGSSRIS
ncbi:hypothetical protein SAY86_025298 [Trapa natans]|uniref:Uncharacterized protein n=1 Tax=Trapa natans TaxID=22666 RepID=A0AAN7M0H5_TRANT|nr:hypothetical protein SAY86_025298 [Trapa natans]